MSNALNIVHVAPEVTPFSESGGLGLVAGALPPALASIGLKVAVITPCYQTVPKELYTETNLHFRVWVGARPSDVTVCEGRLPNDVPVYLIKCDEAYGRRGIYGPRPATDYADNSWRSRCCVARPSRPAGGCGCTPTSITATTGPRGCCP